MYYKILKALEEFFSKPIKLEVPPSHIDADFALITASDKKSKFIASVNAGNFAFFESAKELGPFVNIKLNKSEVYGTVLEEIMSGKLNNPPDIARGKKVFIEYSSPNIAKPFGVGHLRSTVIGEALSRIYEATGYKVHRENHLGDWGTQFGGLIYAYQTWGNEDRVKKNPINELKNLYVRFEKEAKEDKALRGKARDISCKLEEGDKDLVDLWKKFRKWSLEKFSTIYDRLGVEFDNIGGESEFVKDASVLADKVLKLGLASETKEGTIIVEGLDDLPTFVLKTQDGYSVYILRDLAALKERIKNKKFDPILYVVGNEQELNFRQLFALATKMQILNSVEVKHINFGLVLIEGKKMATRRGTSVKLEDLLNESVARAKKIIEEKNPDLKDKNKVAEIVGVGAVIYNDLRQSRQKDISFDWDKMLSFDAGSASYLQYTYIRIKSILDGLDEKPLQKGHIFTENIEFEIAKQLALFPVTLLRAKDDNAPHIICDYLEKLAADFNNFYNNISIINTNETDLRLSRVALADSVSIIIKQGLHLLNIRVPEKM